LHPWCVSSKREKCFFWHKIRFFCFLSRMNESCTQVPSFQWECRFIRKSCFYYHSDAVLPIGLVLLDSGFKSPRLDKCLKTVIFWLRERIYCSNARWFTSHLLRPTISFCMSSTARSFELFNIFINCGKRDVSSLIDFLTIGDALIPPVSYDLILCFLGRSYFHWKDRIPWVIKQKHASSIIVYFIFSMTRIGLFLEKWYAFLTNKKISPFFCYTL